MGFGSLGPVRFVFWQAVVLVPLVIAIWMAVQIVGIRRALDRIAGSLESKAAKVP